MITHALDYWYLILGALLLLSAIAAIPINSRLRKKSAWNRNFERMRRYNDEHKIEISELEDKISITEFNVENGRGENRGSVVINVKWSGIEDSALYVYTDDHQHLHSTIKAFYRLSKYSDIRIDTGLVGHKKNGDDFYFVHSGRQPGRVYNYYAWVEYKISYSAYDIDEEDADLPIHERAALPDKPIRVTRSNVTEMLSRSIALRVGETKEEFLERKKRMLDLERQIKEYSKKPSTSDAKSKKKFSIDEIVEQVVAEIKEEADLAEKIDAIIAELELPEDIAERLEAEIIKRYYESK